MSYVYVTKVKACLKILNGKISLSSSKKSETSTDSGVSRSTRLYLSEIPLSFFDYEGGENLIQFFENFEDIIN